MSVSLRGAFLVSLFFPLPVAAQRVAAPQIQFLSEQIIKAGSRFQGLTVGGISGASYDSATERFFFLSDDKKNHRFYELRLKSRQPYRLKITKQIFLKEKRSPRLKRNMDLEALVFYPEEKAVFVASEGQQIFSLPEGPQIYQFRLDGLLQSAWPIPSVFWDRKKNFGPKPNKGFESLALDSQNHILWTATEEPLRQDNVSSSNQWIRISGFSLKSRKLVFQHGYRTKNPATGLVEMLLLQPRVFLTLEREYIPLRKLARSGSGILSAAGKALEKKPQSDPLLTLKTRKAEGVYKLQLFLTDCKKASSLPLESSLPSVFVACRKTLLFDFARLPATFPDNLEAMTFGPWIAPRKRLLVFAADNNFRPEAQKNQILFFAFSLRSDSSVKNGGL